MPAISISFVYTRLLVWAFLQSYLLLEILPVTSILLFAWLIKLKEKKYIYIYKKRNGHIGVGLSIEGGSNLLYTMIFKGWKEGLWSPELLGGLKCRGPDFKGRDLRPLFVPWSMDNYKLILSTTETAGIK